MSEEGLQPSALELGLPAQASPGAMLRSAREAAGVHIEALAVGLKVSVSKLEALEADNYQALPDPVFVRALASSVCRCLKLDPVPVLALMPQSRVRGLADTGAGINAVFRDGSEKSGGSVLLARVRHPVFLAVVALLLGAAALAFFPRPAAEVAIEANGQEQKASATVSGIGSEAVTSADGASAGQGVAPSVGMPDLGLSVERPSGAASGAAPSALASAVVEAVDGKVQLLVLRARADSWIQVRDASGATTLQKILANGESVVVPGKPPLSVVVGNAKGTEVVVQGKVMDLVSITKDNVARFEVQP